MIDATVPAPVRILPDLDYIPRSPADAVRYLDRLEGGREALEREFPDFVFSCERLILKWAHRYRHWLPYDRYLAAVARVEARDPKGWGRRMFDLGTLGSTARFMRELPAVPPEITDSFARLPEFRPLSQIAMQGELLIVHIGSIAYPGALVIVSESRPPQHTIVRMLGFETEYHGPIVRVSDEDDGVVLAPRGALTVECVIFDRPDVLSCR